VDQQKMWTDKRGGNRSSSWACVRKGLRSRHMPNNLLLLLQLLVCWYMCEVQDGCWCV
jgi:hypothetical protein